MPANVVSLRRLVHDPDAFDGKRITVVAFYSARERPALYVSSAAKAAETGGERILVFPPRAAPASLSETYVLADGFFAKPDSSCEGYRGHLGDLVRFERWSDPAKLDDREMPSVDDAEPVVGPATLNDLIVAPSTFERQYVHVGGFAAVRFEQRALFVTEEAYRNRLSRDAIWLAGDLVVPDLHERRVVVAGRFDASKRGHLSAYAGTLDVAMCSAVVVPAADGTVAAARSDVSARSEDVGSPPSIPIPGHRRPKP